MKDYVKTLKKEHIFQSMSRKDNCLDKSVAAISLLHFGLTYWGHYIKKRCLRATAPFFEFEVESLMFDVLPQTLKRTEPRMRTYTPMRQSPF